MSENMSENIQKRERSNSNFLHTIIHNELVTEKPKNAINEIETKIDEDDIENQNTSRRIKFIINDDEDVDYDNSLSSQYNCLTCITGCSALIGICLIVSSILWLIFSIKALVNESNNSLQEKCKNNNVWAVLLSVTAITVIQIICKIMTNYDDDDNNNNNNNNKSNIIISCCFNIALFIWGGFELYTPCAYDNLRSFRTYQMLE
ncbi:hypothetical protein CL656_03280, partial [bacterium]|nr:hypothetical protein [bacterium]